MAPQAPEVCRQVDLAHVVFEKLPTGQVTRGTEFPAFTKSALTLTRGGGETGKVLRCAEGGTRGARRQGLDEVTRRHS